MPHQRCPLCKRLFANAKNLLLHKRACEKKVRRKMTETVPRAKINFISSQIRENRIEHEWLEKELEKELKNVMEDEK